MPSIPRRAASGLLLSFLLLFIGCQGLPLKSSSDQADLQEKLKERISSFEGIVGLHYHHFESGREISIRADETFPTASLVKIPILFALMEKISTGDLDWYGKLTYDISRRYAGEDLLASFRDGEKISLAKLVDLMIRYSDNTASLWCQELAGTGTVINQWLQSHGYEKTRVNSRTPGREADRSKWGWGQTTPREMTRMLESVHRRDLFGSPWDDLMLKVMNSSYWRDEMLSVFSPEVTVYSKQGAVNQSRSEVIVALSPEGPFSLCVITREQADTSWGEDNAGFVLLRDLARICKEAGNTNP
jgi:beta-lactamase class A